MRLSVRINKPFLVLILLLSIDEEFVAFDVLTITNGVGDGDVVLVLSSGFACLGGIGGGRGTLVAFLFSSLSFKLKYKIMKQIIEL